MNADIHLRIEGSLLERLINRALHAGASFSRIRRTGSRSIVVATDARSAAILSSLCKKYFLDMRTLRRGGRTALRSDLLKRWTLLLGLLLCLGLCWLFLERIWLLDIKFTGSRPDLGNAAVLHDALSALDIKSGTASSAVDPSLLQKQLMASAEDYSYIGVRRQGIRLLVEAAPEAPSPETYRFDHARDLVAARDGVVEAISVHAGTAYVKPGDTVRAGQLLIRGEETVAVDSETRQDIMQPVSALGEVIARCWYEGSAEAPLQNILQVRSGIKSTSSRLNLLGISLPLLQGESYPSQETEIQHLPVVGLFLPLEIEKSTNFETRSVVRQADPAALEEQLLSLARADVFQRLSAEGIQYTVISHWHDSKAEHDTLRLRAVYEINTDIAVTRNAFIEEVY